MNSKKDTVIIPWAEGRSAIASIRSLGKRGIRVIAASSKKDAPGFHSKYVTERFLYPDSHKDFIGYVKAFLNLCKQKNILTIIPLTEPNIYMLSKYKADFSKYIKTPWPDFNTLQRVQDRLKLIELANELGVPTPQTWLLDEVSEDFNKKKKLFILKSRFSILEIDNRLVYGGVRYIDNLSKIFLNGVIEEMGHIPLLQEYIPGTEYGFYALFNKGEIVAKFCMRRIRSGNYKGGASVYRESIKDSKLENLGRILLEELHWHGPAMVEFKKDKRDNTYKLMEINPRFWGSLAVAIHSGVDFPYLFYKLAKYGDVEKVLDYKEHVKVQYIKGDLMYLGSILKKGEVKHIQKPNFFESFMKVMGATIFSKHDVFDIRDIRPFIKDMTYLLKYRNIIYIQIMYNLYKKILLYKKGKQKDRILNLINKYKSITFVCYGNIYRSPFAEYYFKKSIKERGLDIDIKVYSAGFHSYINRKAPSDAIKAARKFGVELTSHRSKLITKQMVSDSGVIFVMDIENYIYINKYFPEAKNRTFLLSELCNDCGLEIEDPYNKGLEACIKAYFKIKKCIDSLIESLEG